MILYLLLSLFIIINVIIAIYDFTFFRIPNVLLLSLIAIFIFYACVEMNLSEFLEHSLLFLGILIFSYGLFAANIIGGGDAKYIPTVALWMGWDKVLPFVLLMTILGGVLSLCYVICSSYIEVYAVKLFRIIQRYEEKYPVLKNVWLSSGTGSDQDKDYKFKKIPYGIAISASAILLIIKIIK